MRTSGGVPADPAAPAGHYLKDELRELLRADPSVLDFFDAAIGDGLWFWDVTRPEEEWLSPRFKELFGYRDDEVPNTAAWWQENIFAEDLPGVIETFSRHCADPTHPYDQIVRYRHRDGSTVWVRCRGLAIRDAAGRAVRLLGAHTDVTALMRGEEALRESEERFRSAFEEGPLGAAILTVDARFRRVNRRLSEMLGYDEAALVGRSLAEVTHPDDAPAEAELWQRLLAGDIGHYQLERRWIRRDGTTMWGRLTRTIVKSAAGERFTLGLIEDTTAVHDAEASQRELDAMKDMFLMVVAHDLRDPIAGIAGLADLLIDDRGEVDPATQRSFLERIRAEAERMQGLVDRLVEAERLAQGAVVAHRRPTDLAALIRRVADAIDRAGHPLDVESDAGGGAVVASVDPALVERIVDNLIRNAVRHTPPGTPIHVRAEVDGGDARIAVNDAGPGVADDQKVRIFERFHTGAASSGSGIGLWAVARLAELHGGRAWVEDRAGGGASFLVLLPAPPADVPGGPSRQPGDAWPGTTGHAPGPRKGP